MMAKEFGKFPHEVIDLDLEDWSFNLFCLVSDLDTEKPKDYSKEVLNMFPKMKDKKYQEMLGKYANKLPQGGIING